MDVKSSDQMKLDISVKLFTSLTGAFPSFQVAANVNRVGNSRRKEAGDFKNEAVSERRERLRHPTTQARVEAGGRLVRLT